MEKRSRGLRSPESFDRCRQVLQRGLQLNPDSACLAQVSRGRQLLQLNGWISIQPFSIQCRSSAGLAYWPHLSGLAVAVGNWQHTAWRLAC